MGDSTMKFKKIRVIVTLMASIFLLVGCSSEKPNISSNTSTSQSKKTSNSKEKNSSSLWNKKQDDQLHSWINQWAPPMHQKYTKYDGVHSLKTSVGETYPEDLNKVTVNGEKTSIGWNKSGRGNYSYNVVAIYNYDGTTPPLPNHITYFFTFHHGQPVTLVDQTRDGDPRLVETENNDVKTNFDRIAEGKSTKNVSGTTTNQSSSQNDSKNEESKSNVTDPKLIGAMVYQEAFNSAYDPDTQAITYFGTDDESGRYNISQGSIESDVQFVIDGNVVHFWQLDPDSSDAAATETQKETTVGLKELESHQYSTSAQKEAIHKIASHFTNDPTNND